MTPQPQPFRRLRFWLSLLALAGAVASAPLLASGPGTLKSDQASLDDGDNGPGGDDDRDHPAGRLRFDDARFEVVEGENGAVVRVEHSGGETGGSTPSATPRS